MSQPIPAENEVHLWEIFLPVTDFDLFLKRGGLDETEHKKSEHFRNPKSRNLYILAHRLLRVVLASYLEINPQSIRYREGKFGKPFLDTQSLPIPGLGFNMSHSHERILIAVSAQNCQVGVDTEFMSHFHPSMAGLDIWMNDAEMDELKTMTDSERLDRIQKTWVAKESLVKAIGGGLNLPLTEIIVPDFSSDTVACRVTLPSIFNGFESNICNWQIRILHSPDGYVSALSIPDNGSNVEVKTMRLSESMIAALYAD